MSEHFKFGRDPGVGSEISSEGVGNSYGLGTGQIRTFGGRVEIYKGASLMDPEEPQCADFEQRRRALDIR